MREVRESEGREGGGGEKRGGEGGVTNQIFGVIRNVLLLWVAERGRVLDMSSDSEGLTLLP